MIRASLLLSAAALALMACEPQPGQNRDAAGASSQPGPAQPAPAQTAPAQSTPEQSAAATPADPNVPRIFMALQPDPSGPTSIIFAIDRARDNTPLNDPAIRLTPEQGQCNPQELRGYPFSPETANRPVFGPQEALSGVTARDLPNFMAMAVTSEMMRQGLVTDPQQSQPQNVCTRKLWEQLIVRQRSG